jgi:hypothetical protein
MPAGISDGDSIYEITGKSRAATCGAGLSFFISFLFLPYLNTLYVSGSKGSNYLIINRTQVSHDGQEAVLRIGIHMFLGLPDPDHYAKIIRKTLLFCDSFRLFFFEK